MISDLYAGWNGTNLLDHVSTFDFISLKIFIHVKRHDWHVIEILKLHAVGRHDIEHAVRDVIVSHCGKLHTVFNEMKTLNFVRKCTHDGAKKQPVTQSQWRRWRSHVSLFEPSLPPLQLLHEWGSRGFPMLIQSLSYHTSTSVFLI